MLIELRRSHRRGKGRRRKLRLRIGEFDPRREQLWCQPHAIGASRRPVFLGFEDQPVLGLKTPRAWHRGAQLDTRIEGFPDQVQARRRQRWRRRHVGIVHIDEVEPDRVRFQLVVDHGGDAGRFDSHRHAQRLGEALVVEVACRKQSGDAQRIEEPPDGTAGANTPQPAGRRPRELTKQHMQKFCQPHCLTSWSVAPSVCAAPAAARIPKTLAAARADSSPPLSLPIASPTKFLLIRPSCCMLADADETHTPLSRLRPP